MSNISTDLRAPQQQRADRSTSEPAARPITLSTDITGSGPGIVLAHGASGSIASNFGSLIAPLAANHTVTASDYPADDTPLHLDALADAVVAAAATERFAMIGFSVGTAVAVRAAARHPDRVTGLVLAAGLARADNRLRLAFDVWAALLRAGEYEAAARFSLHEAFSPRFSNDLPSETIATNVAALTQRFPGGAAAQFALGAELDTTADLAGIHVPTLVISATEDILVAPATHRYLAEHIPGAEYAELPTGHLLMAEQPDAWQRLVLGFLERHRL